VPAARLYDLVTCGKLTRAGVTWSVINLARLDLSDYLDFVSWIGMEV
jgi:hypothetical protein